MFTVSVESDEEVALGEFCSESLWVIELRTLLPVSTVLYSAYIQLLEFYCVSIKFVSNARIFWMLETSLIYDK